MVATTISVEGQKFTISGYVKDGQNGETLIGANVFLRGTGKGTVSNAYGFYSITVEKDVYQLRASYLGYLDFSKEIDLANHLSLDIELFETASQLEEVIVLAEPTDRNVKEIQMSVNKLEMRTIQKIPALLGETDILRTIQLLPGITTVGEGAAGFNVRGGSIDQNLVLLDEAPVYNSSHLFGFFSVFNPDAVKDVQLYKGGIPARYGGRLSSILDVRMKEGNSKQMEVNGGIGSIFSRLAVEAPIVKDKSSFIVAGRRSYIDVLAKPFLEESNRDFSLNFYDLTLKTNYKFSKKDQIFLSGYFGRDNFGLADQAGFNWGNATTTVRWNHLYSDQLFGNITAYYSNYDYKINFGNDNVDAFDWNARIINYSLKSEWIYYLSPTNVLRFGGQSIFYEFQPANAIAISNNIERDISLAKQFSLESNIFFESEWRPFESLDVNAGVRLSHFRYLGNRFAYTYGEAPPGTERPLTGIEFFNKGSTIAQYTYPEPRLGIKYQLGESSSLKASYNRTVQYIHLLSNTTAATPVDIWTPSTNNISPQMADQLALGYFRNFNNDQYELSAEFYYKKMENLIDYIDGADLILNEFLEGQILTGKGRAFGTEWFLKRNSGTLTGWISYTLARTERLVEGINNDSWYPSRFDQTHNFGLTLFYEINKRMTLSSNFVYITGTPVTFATSRFEQQGYIIPHNEFNDRNNVRIPDYHRLDFSLTIDPKEKQGKKWKGQWVVGVYNVYARRNAFAIYFRQEQGRPVPDQPINTEAVRLSVIGSFIPSISYNFKFK
ncbi:MAG TPA: TonB-dependent receptor [Saprospiraceae bacterium]|nr:TonB-dependent receptor [Saprospiraceae bacterium]